jgi:hypothetical protein
MDPLGLVFQRPFNEAASRTGTNPAVATHVTATRVANRAAAARFTAGRGTIRAAAAHVTATRVATAL